jgi:hypothetical protein
MVEEADVVVLAFERLDFTLDKIVQLGKIGANFGWDVEIQGRSLLISLMVRLPSAASAATPEAIDRARRMRKAIVARQQQRMRRRHRVQALERVKLLLLRANLARGMLFASSLSKVISKERRGRFGHAAPGACAVTEREARVEGRIMIPSLEELRRSLLSTPEVHLEQAPSDDYRFQTTAARIRKSAPSTASEKLEPRAAQPVHNPFAQLLDDDDPFAELRANLEQAATDIENVREEAEALKPPADIEEAVALVFGSSVAYEEHLARLADASRSIRRLDRIAREVFEPLKIFRDKVQRLRISYEAAAPNEPETVFRRRLARLLPPDKPIQTFDRTAVTFGEHLSALSTSLELAKTLHAHLVSLARTFDAAETLESELKRMSRTR